MATSFHVADLLSYARCGHEDFDVVLAAFSLHHLLADAKGEVFKAVHRLLVRHPHADLL